jgi:molybdopterin biosynthesis enzyme
VKQQQFLEVIERDEAERRWRATLDITAVPAETVALEDALGRVLAEDVRAEVDVPGFDRSNMDGFAVRAEDTYGATETQLGNDPYGCRAEPGSVVRNGDVDRNRWDVAPRSGCRTARRVHRHSGRFGRRQA